MKKTLRPVFKKKQLVIALSLATLGGAMTGCSNDAAVDGGPKGAFNILANGGVAGSAMGSTGMYAGAGGNIYLWNSGGAGGVDFLDKGVANTKFKSPKLNKKAALGDNPLMITSDTVINGVNLSTAVPDGNGTTTGEYYLGDDNLIRTAAGGSANYATDPVIAAGTAYLSSGGDRGYYMYIATGAAYTTDQKVTGISVASAATLGLGNNNGNSTRVEFLNDIVNDGTITRAATDDTLRLNCDKYLATGSIVNKGVLADKNAGAIYVYAVNGIDNSGTIDASGFDDPDGGGGSGDTIQLDADGYVLNSGILNSSGGDGSGAGGSGGAVRLYGAYTENTGPVDASGGNNITDGATAGNGGSGGQINFWSNYVTNNTADIDLSGGDGSRGGNSVCCSYIQNDDLGEVKNAGNININGGIGHTDDGGDTGSLYMYAYGGNLLNSGDLTLAGGATNDVASDGGNGGYVEFNSYYGDNNEPQGDVVVSGNLNVSGANAIATGTGQGGYGGEITLQIDGAEGEQRVALLGYLSASLNGGDGGEFSGRGGEVNLMTWFVENEDTGVVTSGSVKNTVPITALGGNNTKVDGGEGGYGGEIHMSTFDGAETADLDLTTTNTADLDVSGGTGFFFDGGASGDMDAGDGGIVSLYSSHGTSNSGDIIANNGDGGEGTGSSYGHYGIGGYVTIDAGDGPAKNTGAYTANGGAGGADSSGDGGRMSVFSYLGDADNTGAVTANGGAGGMWGGYGGEVSVYSDMGNARNTGALTANGGVGENGGGYGGELYVQSSSGTARNTGDVLASGADGGEYGGDGGVLTVDGQTGTNTGDFTANGGNATNPGDIFAMTYGGDGGEATILGAGLFDSAVNKGAISFNPGMGITPGDEGCLQVGITFTGNCN